MTAVTKWPKSAGALLYSELEKSSGEERAEARKLGRGERAKMVAATTGVSGVAPRNLVGTYQ
jgi:hypothetical protein